MLSRKRLSAVMLTLLLLERRMQAPSSTRALLEPHEAN
jgi:hypothetical protein